VVTKKTNMDNLFGLYVHWPYCIHKCPYCDFASTVCPHPNEEALLKTYIRDLDCFPSQQPLTSLFFGGGTPSLMSPSFLEKLMDAIKQRYVFSPDIEISMEVNPDTVDKIKLQEFKKLGVNRLSIGVQSFNDTDLRFLGRTHTAARAIQCIHEAQDIFQNINIDLIYARPHQTLKAWQQELSLALDFHLSHYSLYQLTIEEGTVFDKQNIPTATETQANRLYRLTDAMMNAARQPAYEVSNYAKKGFECRHNMTYWLGQNYIGIGPSAHGRLGLKATTNQRSVAAWVKTPPHIESLTTQERALEKLLMGLRLHQHPFPVKGLNPNNIQKAIDKGWIIQKGTGILPTLKGTLMLNQLILLLAD